MKIITDPVEKARIESWDRKLGLREFSVLNTSWARDKYGSRDTINLSLFIELVAKSGGRYYWQIGESELNELNKHFNEVKKYNMENDHQGKEYREQFELNL